ncbi:hypothetical protein [Mesorhizobium sp.]|uniref:hypothetical protein n=1 Tax=Mesorhizobium sp. TaxID=1871066 RepID=UPI000FE78F08|nr:hypothetical protein [Mesorhizobium sp.]RWI29561.1 MAG: hypothetical protein EOQ92_04235 [Mesorhizobium sp.]RWK52524.1 MAG: hypothetical protein EOR47_03825 [Mesorhizobium sp.]TIP57467.1 MAG: hypothetical protein E5X56_19915 [Mesorhizobium sp.]TIP77786.1 MAG: hypothetical protein E5X60_40730 [Mesorhizobium sp.]TIQ29684.1 MAG: hypothetical protein E5X54_12340 [Mesorhizobium sp.]
MTIAHVEVITSGQRRRRWSRAEKERLVAATVEPRVTVSEDSQYRMPATSTDLRRLPNFS